MTPLIYLDEFVILNVTEGGVKSLPRTRPELAEEACFTSRSISAQGAAQPIHLHKLVILNVTEGGVRDLLYLSFHIGAKRRSTNRGEL